MKHGHQSSMGIRCMAELQQAWKLILVANILFLKVQTAPCNSSLVTGPLGVEDHALTGPLPYGLDPRTHPKEARIVNPVNYYHAYIGYYLQVQLKKPSVITGFITQGRTGNWQFVTEYKVQYSNYGTTWQNITDSDGNVKLFTGNVDAIGLAKSILNTSITASYIRVTPTSWNYHLAFRLEILGCPIIQPELRHTCWEVHYVTWIPSEGIFSTTRANIGECGKECHRRDACQAFTFNLESGQCQGHPPSSVVNATAIATADAHNMLRVFKKKEDCA